MKKIIKTHRILKINPIQGFTISCTFNNGETREIDFKKLFNKWKVSKDDPEYKLLDFKEFKKVGLRNNTLSWKNIQISLLDIDGNEQLQPFEIDPLTLFRNSKGSDNSFKKFNIGPAIKKARTSKGLSQDELALRSGTSKTYISRIENNKIDPTLHTLHKIVEVGLGRKIELKIL
ncbi:MAG: helix-turn-helix domain-containing protein [Terrimonas sp.]|nr:helix-turn-helix domain-containing protein [Terrimonas sp.]